MRNGGSCSSVYVAPHRRQRKRWSPLRCRPKRLQETPHFPHVIFDSDFTSGSMTQLYSKRLLFSSANNASDWLTTWILYGLVLLGDRAAISYFYRATDFTLKNIEPRR